MGSKNLKAIAVRGTKGSATSHGPGVHERHQCRRRKILADNAVTGQGLPTYGTQVLMNVINEIGALPTRNHRDVQFEGREGHLRRGDGTPRKGDGKRSQLVTNQACFGCTIACGRIQQDRQGPLLGREQAAVLGRLRRPGVRGGLGAGCRQWRQRPRRAAVRQHAVQRDGIDPISFGATVGAVMELYDMGVLTKEQLGIDAKFTPPRR